MMKSAKPVARDGVTSLEEFRILYENDLGLPENTGTASDDAAEQCRRFCGCPAAATEVVRRWDGPTTVKTTAEVRHTFDNGEQLSIIMAAGQPQDYTLRRRGKTPVPPPTSRSSTRARWHIKSVWPLYPVLSEQEQQALGAAAAAPLPAARTKTPYGIPNTAARRLPTAIM